MPFGPSFLLEGVERNDAYTYVDFPSSECAVNAPGDSDPSESAPPDKNIHHFETFSVLVRMNNRDINGKG